MFHGFVGYGDEVARPLLAHVAGGELGVARHDLFGSGLDDEPGHPIDIDTRAHACRCMRSKRARSSGVRLTVR